MDSRFIDYFKTNKFTHEQDIYYGIYRNRNISVVFRFTTIKVVVAFNQQIGKDQGKNISNKISEIKHNSKSLVEAITTNIHIDMTFYQSENVFDEFVSVVDKVLDVLDSYKLNTNEICPLCGKLLSTKDQFVRIGNSTFQAHEKCIDELVKAGEAFEGQVNKKPKLNSLFTHLICLATMILCVGLSCSLALTTVAGGAMIVSGCVCLFLSGLVMGKFHIPTTTRRLVLRSVFAVLTVLIATYLGGAIIYYKVYGVDVFIKYFEYFKETFSDGFINSKNRIYDIITGLGLLAFTINTEIKFASSQKRDITLLNRKR